VLPLLEVALGSIDFAWLVCICRSRVGDHDFTLYIIHSLRTATAKKNRYTTAGNDRYTTNAPHQLIGLQRLRIARINQSINQRSSHSHTRAEEKPHPSNTTGGGGKPCITKSLTRAEEKPHPSTTTGGANPASQSDAGCIARIQRSRSAFLRCT